MRIATKRTLTFSVLAALGLAAAYTPRMVQQRKYRAFFANRDICFDLPIQGSADYRWFSAVKCSTGERLQILHGAPDAELSFLDVNGDNVPELYITGENPAVSDENYFSYSGNRAEGSLMFSALPSAQIRR